MLHLFKAPPSAVFFIPNKKLSNTALINTQHQVPFRQLAIDLMGPKACSLSVSYIMHVQQDDCLLGQQIVQNIYCVSVETDRTQKPGY